MKHFILDPSCRVIETDLRTWGRWIGDIDNRELGRTAVGYLLVVTAFAGLDVRFGDGPPAFFETRVLDGLDELECLESVSWDDALVEHLAVTQRWRDWSDAARCATERVLADR